MLDSIKCPYCQQTTKPKCFCNTRCKYLYKTTDSSAIYIHIDDLEGIHKSFPQFLIIDYRNSLYIRDQKYFTAVYTVIIFDKPVHNNYHFYKKEYFLNYIKAHKLL